MAKIVGNDGQEHLIESRTVQIRPEKEVALSKLRPNPRNIWTVRWYIYTLRIWSPAEMGSTVPELRDIGESRTLGM